jgi:hypothetical protein
LRGGGGNFGVVTAFEFELHPVAEMLLELTVFAATDGRGLLGAYSDWLRTAPDHFGGGILYTGAFSMGFFPEEIYGRQVWMLFVSTPAELGLAGTERLREIPARPLFSTTLRMTYPALQSAFDDTNPRGTRAYNKSVMLNILDESVIDALLETAASKSDSRSRIELNSLGGAVARVDENQTAFSQRSAVAIASFPAVLDPPNEERERSWVRRAWELMRDRGGGVYSNYAGEDDPLSMQRTFGASKYARLQAVKKEYDPENLFRLNQNIRPA